MTIQCPTCKPVAMHLVRSMELPPDSRSDEVTLSLYECGRCGCRAATVYEESRRGAMDDDSYHVDGFLLAEADYDLLRRIVGRCPAPSARQCTCPAHAILSRTGASGAWDGLRANGIVPSGYFDVITENAG
jgi:hypothetical protein